MAHLVTGRPPPVEWLEFVLMDRFKWTPAEVRAISLADGLRLLTMINSEAKAQRGTHG